MKYNEIKKLENKKHSVIERAFLKQRALVNRMDKYPFNYCKYIESTKLHLKFAKAAIAPEIIKENCLYHLMIYKNEDFSKEYRSENKLEYIKLLEQIILS